MIRLLPTSGTGRDRARRHRGAALATPGVHRTWLQHLQGAMPQARRGTGSNEPITARDRAGVFARRIAAGITDGAIDLSMLAPADLAWANSPVSPGQRQRQLLGHVMALQRGSPPVGSGVVLRLLERWCRQLS